VALDGARAAADGRKLGHDWHVEARGNGGVRGTGRTGNQ
jgi:hypothetical protein